MVSKQYALCEFRNKMISFISEDASSHLPLPFNMFIRHMLHVAFGRIVTDRQEQVRFQPVIHWFQKCNQDFADFGSGCQGTPYEVWQYSLFYGPNLAFGTAWLREISSYTGGYCFQFEGWKTEVRLVLCVAAGAPNVSLGLRVWAWCQCAGLILKCMAVGE